jgi:peptidoglycan/LPS O-acetylase OafA/YrhL
MLRPKTETRSFRPDVQGLRAIAVMLVALSHAGVGFLQGGFVGVDVFFVISGFLITGFLLRRNAESGRVPFFEFYAARARRILPAATLTIAATVIASWHYLNYVRALSAFYDAIWSGLFAANIHFSQVGTDYFAQSNPPSPLQHFWTLAVEEQFYIVWPALLALLLFATRRNPSRLIAATSLLCFASLIYCIGETEKSQTTAYFSTIARAWELGLGALIAMLAANFERLSAALRATLTWIGMAAIIVAGVTFSATTEFPGYAVLLPVLGSALVLVGGLGGAPRFGVGAILRYQPFQFVGDTSYAFYLWHWPILTIAAQYAGHKLTVAQNLGLLAIGLAVSAFTYLTFENPLRRAKALAMPRAALALWPVTVGLVLILARVAISVNPAYGVSAPPLTPIVPQPLNRYTRLVAQSVTPARLAAPIPAALNPTVAQAVHDLPSVTGCPLRVMRLGGTCVLGDLHATRTFAVLGDSHANAWMPAFNYFAKQHHYRLIGLTRDGCTFGILSTPNHPVCSALWTKWLQRLSEVRPDFLVVAQRFDTVLPAGQMYLGLRQELDAFDQIVPHTVVMEDSPYHAMIDPTDCLLRHGAALGDCTMRFGAYIGAKYDTMREIVQAHPQDRYLLTRRWFCSDDKCPIVIGNTIAYRDTHHVSDTYVRDIAPAVSSYLWELTRTG